VIEEAVERVARRAVMTLPPPREADRKGGWIPRDDLVRAGRRRRPLPEDPQVLPEVDGQALKDASWLPRTCRASPWRIKGAPVG